MTSVAAPPGVLASLAGWYVVGVVLLGSGLDSSRTSSGEGMIGSVGVASTTGSPWASLLLVSALVVVVAGGLLAAGIGWAVYPLVLVATLAVVGGALAGSWLTLVLTAGLLVGVVPLWSSRSYRYLHGR